MTHNCPNAKCGDWKEHPAGFETSTSGRVFEPGPGGDWLAKKMTAVHMDKSPNTDVWMLCHRNGNFIRGDQLLAETAADALNEVERLKHDILAISRVKDGLINKDIAATLEIARLLAALESALPGMRHHFRGSQDGWAIVQKCESALAPAAPVSEPSTTTEKESKP
jgi:hypothetical protein